MKSPLNHENRKSQAGFFVTIGRATTLALLSTAAGYGQGPWDIAVNSLRDSFTGTIAKGLSLVAIVIGGLTLAYAEGSSKKVVAGILFGVGMAVSAVSFMAWLFP